MGDDRLAFSQNVGNVGWKRSWYHSRSRKIVCDRDLLFSLFLFSTWKKNFYSCSVDHMRIKILEGKAIPLRLINLPILVHYFTYAAVITFLSFYSPLCSSIKYLNTQSCLRVLSSFYTVEVWKIYNMNVNSCVFITIKL